MKKIIRKASNNQYASTANIFEKIVGLSSLSKYAGLYIQSSTGQFPLVTNSTRFPAGSLK